ncbi:MAG TPA: DUF3046 domain-containing protein [Candidatus Lumbricidophila sp.]|nr:DUF3046 domain-containing protein [Candidatus Lumbricidophila sp.]
MKLQEFERAVRDEFGAGYGAVVRRDLVLPDFGGTADEALGRGIPARDVWLALCQATDVPPARWYGAGRPAPKPTA